MKRGQVAEKWVGKVRRAVGKAG